MGRMFFAGSPEGEKGFSLGKFGKQNWIVLLLLGVLLAVIALPASREDKNSAGAESAYTGNLSTGDAAKTGAAEGAQKTNCEQQLEELLSQVEGIGRVKVIVRMDGNGGGMVSYQGGQEEGKVTGVLVAAQGADHSVVVQNIQEAVMALFQVEAHKIKVMKMK